MLALLIYCYANGIFSSRRIERTSYRDGTQNQASIEPVIGIIKKVLGFEQFLLRGLAKVSLEWTLVCTAFNLKRLHKLVRTSC
jgi:Transposase DDE domain